ncbi:hypothetical protein K2Z83_08080 [Oscillochloris sp. ZM17-4]|uniref:hypothetical protein n=1 Tax=Oscillochloris sp. ZM17-4 TaxID=2866714 RepID=UPI001C73AA40|nr:hypothetical protein [Oscillochloris sp. ZM17-4]MBX0327634.1 hypothetical protein [Oscillochloris sp. ZM17-4]
MNYEWLTLMPLAQAAITLSLSGFALLVILMAIGAYGGYQAGIRNILTIAIWSIIAYITCVQGGNFLVDLINRFWQNGPRLVAFAIGNNPDAALRLDPLIEPGFQVPLFFRVVSFIALVLFGFFFNRKAAWKGPPKEPLAKPLGLFVGGLIALIWTNASVVFWSDFQSNGGTFGGPVATILNTLPDVSLLLPSLIAVFFLILIILVVFYFPRVWKP